MLCFFEIDLTGFVKPVRSGVFQRIINQVFLSLYFIASSFLRYVSVLVAKFINQIPLHNTKKDDSRYV